MSLAREFQTIDILLGSDAETRGVDAFALSLIKAERQARRLLTYLVYQHPWCDRSTVPALKSALESSGKVYFEGLLAGWNAFYPRSVEQLIGSHYERLRGRLREAAKHRNKIFHGQLTVQGLKRHELLAFVDDIREWCSALARAAEAEVAYAGCANSFRKASDPRALYSKYRTQLGGIAAYRQFIKDHMERAGGPTKHCN